MKGTKVRVGKEYAQRSKYRDGVRDWVAKIVWFASGFLVAGGAVFGEYAPFGASILAAVPFKHLFWSLMGTGLGYMVLSPSSSFRSLATMLAVAAIRWTLSDVKKVTKSTLYAPIVAFLPMLATGMILAVVGGFTSNLIIMCVIEALLSAIGAYFFTRTITLSNSNRVVTKFNQQELACVVMTGCILLLAFSRISFAGISVGRILAVFAILICAKYGAVAGGTISGVSTGVMFGLANSEYSHIAGGYAFGGLLGGLFAPLGRIGTSLSFLICNTVMALQSGDTEKVLSTIYETLIASGIFIAFPKEWGNKISFFFAPPADQTKTEGLRKNIIMRLGFASEALGDVSKSVDSVAGKMRELFKKDVGTIYGKSAQDVCENCGLRSYCWKNQQETTINDFHSLTRPLQEKGHIEENDFSERFQKRCCKPKEMADAVNKNYDAYLAYQSAERRVGEVRAVVAGQFSGLSDILREMSQEFEHYERFDTLAAERVSEAMKGLGLTPLDVSCRVDVLGRMSIEVETSEGDRNNLKRAQLVRDVSKACGRRMDFPCISYVPNRCRVQFSEKAYYDTEIGSAQHISGNGQFCGDSLNYFIDGLGRMVIVISDGMGTGGRAAVDSNMAQTIMTKLCKAGLGFDSALKVVNSALMVKSEDESLATLDISCVDLYTGKVEIMKAGAAITFVKKNDKVMRYDATSLPAGILTDVNLTHDDVWLRNGDWIVMVSDGAVTTGDIWLEKILDDWKKGTAKELSDKIIKEAKDRRTDGYDDDITVIAVKVVSKQKEAEN